MQKKGICLYSVCSCPSEGAAGEFRDMRIAVPKETRPGETRVALAPESCKKLIQAGYAVAIESGAGAAAFYSDDAYREAGCAIEIDPAALLGAADLVLKVNAPA